jgi:ADP-heptose:LPS heptosyltransferase
VSALQDLGRAALLRGLQWTYPTPLLPAPAIDPKALRKVLVVRTDTRVGNVLLTTPLVRALRRGLPGARVDFLVADGKQGLVEGLADRVIPFQKQDFFRAPWRFWSLMSSLQRERYDVAIEAGHWHAFSFTSGWVTAYTHAAVRVGHRRGAAERFLTHPLDKDLTVEREVPSKLELLRPLGVAADGEQLDTTVDAAPEVGREADALAAQLSGGRPLVSMNPGARKVTHRWPAEAYGALARRLADGGAQPVVLWGPGEEAIADAVVAASGGAAVRAPPTRLPLLAGLFRRSQLVVTNDTGPMHLAVATGAPVVAVLLAEDGGRWSHGGKFRGVAVRSGAGDEVARVLAAAQALLQG